MVKENSAVIKRPSNYDKTPVVKVSKQPNKAIAGWAGILKVLKAEVETASKNNSFVIAVEYYPGVDENELFRELIQPLNAESFIFTSEIFKSEPEIKKLTEKDVTEDAIFGFMTTLNFQDFFDSEKLEATTKSLRAAKGLTVVYGYGATLLASSPDVLIYADMPRWEIQQRSRRGEIANLGLANKGEKVSLQYKRGYFVDWRVADRHKKSQIDQWDYVLDTTKANSPKLVDGGSYRIALEEAVSQPFRVVPFFDPGPWGGQWMKEVCDLDREQINFAWCFDCVPEENSLFLKFGDLTLETPALNLILHQPQQLLGQAVQERFGDEFPIRFDFLDTMGGGNLSLQVHPTPDYIKKKFGMNYTQDESYYFLDAEDDAIVYLGLKDEAKPEDFIADLEEAQESGEFDVDKYVAKWPVKKHDHILIPSGTIHCSGANSMVLEISATPYIFTFKLWDWGRLGLDGKPRPINIERGKKVIDWSRREEWTKRNLVNIVEKIDEGEGWTEEKTGLHESEFIETRRHWFSKPVLHNTKEGVNVLNLIEGREAIVESPSGSFEPFVVHFAETFIIPAVVGEYIIRPYGESENQKIATIKAFVRK